MKTIVAISTEELWKGSQKTGQYVQSTIDSTLEDVGFIHCTFPDQTLETANKHFLARNDILLLFIDMDKVKSPVKIEAALSGRPGLFPHIYGALNTDAVFAQSELKKNAEGRFMASPMLQELIER
ncbi:MAG: DUF952 domain-containing protein [Candidatus Saccharibacteria bacterium]